MSTAIERRSTEATDLVNDAPAAHENAMTLYREVERLHAEVEDQLKRGLDRQHNKIVLRNGPGRGPGHLEDHPALEGTRAALERARQSFDRAWAVYLEAARARDAHEANALAKSNKTVARAIMWLTLVLAVAAIVQTAIQYWRR
jgi:hypothetical protein